MSDINCDHDFRQAATEDREDRLALLRQELSEEALDLGYGHGVSADELQRWEENRASWRADEERWSAEAEASAWQPADGRTDDGRAR